MIYGNKEGIRDSLLAKLETLYDIEIPAEVFAPAPSTAKLAYMFRAAAKCLISPLAV